MVTRYDSDVLGYFIYYPNWNFSLSEVCNTITRRKIAARHDEHGFTHSRQAIRHIRKTGIIKHFPVNICLEQEDHYFLIRCHMPIYTRQLLEDMCEKRNRKPPHGSLQAYMMLGEDTLGSKPNPVARDLVAFLRNQKSLRAILAGHLHFEWRGVFDDRVPMLVAGGNFEGLAYEISFT